VRAAAHEALAYAARGEVALVFGSEMSGLSNAELARCQLVATIPSDPAFSSLNLAAAVQVAAYELRVASGAGQVSLDFLRPAHPKRLLPRLRRLFARARLEKEEVNILRGILARIDERLQRTRKAE
jgi:tRNA/rRNA methyltransferase